MGSVCDDTHLVNRAQLVNQHAKCLFHKPQSVLSRHGAGHVDNEHQGHVLGLLGPVPRPCRPTLISQTFAAKGRWSAIDVDCERSLGRRLVPLIEVAMNSSTLTESGSGKNPSLMKRRATV